MPLAAIIGDRIFCVHGGISPHLETLSQIESLKRPLVVPDSGFICDLLWSDPDPDISDWGINDRGVSCTFGAKSLQEFLKKFDFELLVRGHQVVEDGYQFFAGKKCVTLFTASNYMNMFKNASATLYIDEEMVCSFKVYLRSNYLEWDSIYNLLLDIKTD